MNFNKYLNYTVAVIWIVLLAVLISITVIEKVSDAEYAHEELYSSSWFLVLWSLFTVVSCIYILRRKLYRRRITLMLHFSLLVILAGALATWCLSERGRIHISENQSTSQFVDEDGIVHEMPFEINLKNFEIEYYKGTSTPMDFISTIIVTRPGGNTKEEGVISMNKIFSYDSYRFYQTGYDDNSTILSVSHDPYGIAVTYTGYLLLLVSMIMFVFSRKSRFHALLHKVITKGGALVILPLAFVNLQTSAAENTRPDVLPKEVASRFGDLYIYYNDRVCPMQTFAREFTRKIYGSDSYRGFTPEQVLTGWIFYYDSWKHEPVFKIKSSGVRNMMGIENGYAALDSYFTSQNQYCLEESLRQIHKGDDVNDRQGIIEADEKFVIVSQVATGAAIKIFPYVIEGGRGLEWFSQVGHLPDELEHGEWVFVRKSLDYLNEQVLMQRWDDALHVIQKIKDYQIKKAGDMLPSKYRTGAEKIYNSIEYTRPFSISVLSAGLLLLIFISVLRIKNRHADNKVLILADVITLAAWAYLSVVMCLRGYISGHLPMSNGYETMQFMAWCTLLLTFVFRNRYVFIRPFGLVITGFALLVSMLGISNPQITPLMPVLSSPLLSVHVMVIMIAYALLSFVMLNGIMALVMYRAHGNDREVLKSFQDISELLLYPAVFLLATGIFIGAVWANVSWGRYWGWDPKETWALITMLVYAMALHRDSFSWFRNPVFFHIFSIVAFLSVLITYFGVNFMLGGMHSYA